MFCVRGKYADLPPWFLRIGGRRLKAAPMLEPASLLKQQAYITGASVGLAGVNSRVIFKHTAPFGVLQE